MAPCAVFFCISEAVVESVVATLPEFHRLGNHSEPAPEIGFGDGAIGEAFFEFRIPGQEVVARGNFGALVRDPSADTASSGAGIKIRSGFLDGEFFHRADDFDLALEGNPRKEKSGAGVVGEMPALAAGVVGEKHKPALVEILQQNCPASGLPGGIDGSQRHGIRFRDSAPGGLVEPKLELGDRVGQKG